MGGEEEGEEEVQLQEPSRFQINTKGFKQGIKELNIRRDASGGQQLTGVAPRRLLRAT